MLLTLFTLF